MKIRYIFLVLIMSYNLSAQFQDAINDQVVVEKDGYELRTSQVESLVLQAVVNGTLPPSPTQKQLEDHMLTICMNFMQNPQSFISLHLNSKAKQDSNLNGIKPQTQEHITEEPYFQRNRHRDFNNKSNNRIANGHQLVQDKLAGDIGQMNFYSQGSNAFKNYLYGSVLSSSSNTVSQGKDSYGKSSSSFKLQFCPDGSFISISESSVNISSKDFFIGTGKDNKQFFIVYG